MGHIDLRLLPTAQRWQKVVGFISPEGTDPQAVALAVLTAAQDRLVALKNDPQVGYCVWLLVRLASASRGPDFPAATRQLGLDVSTATSPLAFLFAVTERIRAELDRAPVPGPFGELALAACTSALVQTFGHQTMPLFGWTPAAIEDCFRTHSTPSQFAALHTRFMGEFLSRILRFYVDKTLLLQVGPGRALTSIYQAEVIMNDLTTYAHRIAGATEPFAAEWLSKHHWLEEGAISRDSVQGFVAHAVDKVQRTLSQEQAAT